MDIKVTTKMDVGPGLLEAWQAYADAFREVNTLAVNRHLMTFDEFIHIAQDERVIKYLAYEDGELAGMSCITNDLAAWDFLIAPEYFERNYPEKYARRAIWYIGFVFSVGGVPHVFRDLLGEMYPQVLACDGMFVQDFCTYNVNRGLPEATEHVASWLRGEKVQLDRIDEQAWYAGHLSREGISA